MATRILSAVIALPAILYLMHLGGWAFSLLVLVVAAICLLEFMTMTLPKDRVSAFVMVVLGVFIVFCVMVGWIATPFAILIGAAIPLVALFLFLFRTGDIDTVASRIGLATLGVLWGGAMLGATAAIRLLPQGFSWFLLACWLAWGSDTGAYFTGRFFGKRKLYEKVSPKKTWEGSIGGVLLATGGAFVLQSVLGAPDIPIWQLAIVAPVCTIVGQMGDLAESLLKRSVGVKDSGKIMPGHGGLLDRVDALVFLGPWLLGYALLVLKLDLTWLPGPW